MKTPLQKLLSIINIKDVEDVIIKGDEMTVRIKNTVRNAEVLAKIAKLTKDILEDQKLALSIRYSKESEKKSKRSTKNT